MSCCSPPATLQRHLSPSLSLPVETACLGSRSRQVVSGPSPGSTASGTGSGARSPLHSPTGAGSHSGPSRSLVAWPVCAEDLQGDGRGTEINLETIWGTRILRRSLSGQPGSQSVRVNARITEWLRRKEATEEEKNKSIKDAIKLGSHKIKIIWGHQHNRLLTGASSLSPRGHASCTARPPSPHTADKTPSDPLRGAVKPHWTGEIGGKELVDSPVGCELTEAGDSLAVDGATICVCADATVLDCCCCWWTEGVLLGVCCCTWLPLGVTPPLELLLCCRDTGGL